MVPGELSLPLSNLAWFPFSQSSLMLPSAPKGWFPGLRQLSCWERGWGTGKEASGGQNKERRWLDTAQVGTQQLETA